jgi:hypothetical protein
MVYTHRTPHHSTPHRTSRSLERVIAREPYHLVIERIARSRATNHVQPSHLSAGHFKGPCRSVGWLEAVLRRGLLDGDLRRGLLAGDPRRGLLDGGLRCSRRVLQGSLARERFIHSSAYSPPRLASASPWIWCKSDQIKC